ncbi:MAG TPA: hypothetical protein DCR70_07235 [Phycisphaerales bacterium]|nr:hypothetical protein [Phycisphaerales bacterium]
MLYWIIAGNGQAYGPADLALMHRWVAERRIVSTTQVATSEHGPWRDAALVTELARAFGDPDYESAASAASTSDHATHAPGTPPTAPTTPQSTSMPMSGEWPPSPIAISQLVSGIFHLITATGWLLTCFGVILSVPLTILGIYELIAYSRARATPPQQYLESTKTKAILDICSVLAGNLGSMVCGIVILTQLPAARDRIDQNQQR